MADELLNAQDLITAKKHDTFHSEVITGKAGGLSTGADIDYATNAVTGQVQKTLLATINGLDWSYVGKFADGVTFTKKTDFALDANGTQWIYVGASPFPVVVPAGTVPSAPDYQVILANQFDDGSSADPSISFKNDPDTGLFRKAGNALGFSTGGIERAVIDNNGFIGIGTETPTAKLHVEVDDEISAGIRSQCSWVGGTGDNYQNNDVIFTDARNSVLSNSENWSWGISASNAFNKIPAGVIDSGYRIGAYGWAVSVNAYGYTHAGTLALQIGVRGRAGYQGGGALESPAGSIVQKAVGVRGEIVSDSAGAKIQNAYSGEFLAYGYSASSVDNNYAVFADARNGVVSNWSFYGNEGKFFQKRQAFFSSDITEVENPAISARNVGNNVEFGYPSTGGYGGVLGATISAGWPVLCLGAEVGTTGNTFTTKGFAGHVNYNDLNGNSIFAVIPSVNAANQNPAEAFRVTATAGVKFANRIALASAAPASSTATGSIGQIAWDASYIYLCVATNTWKRVALATW